MPPKTNIPTMKHVSGNIMLWCSFSAKKTAWSICIKETMTGARYDEKLSKNLIPSVRSLRTKHGWIFQHENDPKHTSRTMEWLHKNPVKVLKWPSLLTSIHCIICGGRCCLATARKHPSSWDDLHGRMGQKQQLQLVKSWWSNVKALSPNEVYIINYWGEILLLTN